MAFANGPKIVTDGLVLSLDAADRNSYPGSGTAWNDLVGSNNGTLTNGPTFNSSNGGSIVFDGVDDYVQINPQSPITPFNQSRTVSIWFKPNVFPTSNYSEIIITGNQYNPSVPMWEINLAPNNGLDLYQGGNHYSMGTNIITTGSIVNVHYLFNSTNNKIDFYLNGNLIYSNTIADANLQSNNIYLGVGYWGATNLNIYNTQIYNKALTTSEVQQNFNALRKRFGL